jgi:uncharacterized protein (TIGR02001 family)
MKPKCLFIVMLLSVLAMPVHADNGDGDISGNVQFMTNYIGRGLTQSVGQPSIEGEVDYYAVNGLYTNLEGTSINWIDQIYPGDSVSVEIDGVVGYRHTFADDWTYKFGVLRLQFPGRYTPQSPPTDQPNSTELFGYLSWRHLSARLDYSLTNYFAAPDSKGSTYLDLSASQPCGDGWNLGAHLGFKREAGHDPVTGLSNSRSNYTDYKLYVAYTLGDGMTLTLAETWTNADAALYTINGYDAGGHHAWMMLEKDF